MPRLRKGVGRLPALLRPEGLTPVGAPPALAAVLLLRGAPRVVALRPAAALALRAPVFWAFRSFSL